MLTEISQREKDKYCNDITYMRNLKNKPVSLKKKKGSWLTEDKVMVTGWGWRKIHGCRRRRYKLLDIRQVQGCIVQHREYSQYFEITVDKV